MKQFKFKCVVTVNPGFCDNNVDCLWEAWSETFNAPEFNVLLTELRDYCYIGSSFVIGHSEHFGILMELSVNDNVDVNDFFYEALMRIPGVTGGTVISPC